MAPRLERGLGRMRYAAGMTRLDMISDIQKIHRQPRNAVRTPPRMRPMLAQVSVESSGLKWATYMKPNDPAAPHIPRALAFLAGSVKYRATWAWAGGMVNAAPIPWNALAITSPMKVGERAQTKLNNAKNTMPKSRTRRWLRGVSVSCRKEACKMHLPKDIPSTATKEQKATESQRVSRDHPLQVAGIYIEILLDCREGNGDSAKVCQIKEHGRASARFSQNEVVAHDS